MNFSQSALEYLPEIEDLPLILAGPMLRHTSEDRLTVWLALKEKRSLCLEVYELEANGTKVGKAILRGRRDTVRLGKHLYVVAITATSFAGELLLPGKLYGYDLYADDDNRSLLRDDSITAYSLSYFEHQLPTFALPPDNLDRLKIIHGSCRKPHGGGIDTLAYLDRLIGDSAKGADARPHQLFLTGDQIYGDDVADPILWLLQGVSRLLFDWTEELPLISGSISADELLPGKRTQIAELEGGFTSMFGDAPEKAKSHLFSFGEYVAAYLLAWSPVLVPPDFPGAEYPYPHQDKGWKKETKKIASFIKDLGCVRRGMANIPVYTICDDHDISDDWYLNRRWCDRVLGKPLGKRVVQNGLLAYGLFQAWGNTPQYFEPGTSGAELLDLATAWLASKGRDSAAKDRCDRYLGIPPADETGLPQYESDGEVIILARCDRAIPWFYTVRSSKHEVIVLDTRTWRGYRPEEERAKEPPQMLSKTGFQKQLAANLSQNKCDVEATLIVLPTNLVALDIIDRIQQLELKRDRVFRNDVGDSWNFNDTAFAQLLLTLSHQRDRVIILSGDIHYSCALRIDCWLLDNSASSVLVQLTSSAIKNSELPARLAHTKLKSLFPEPDQRWVGYYDPPTLTKLSSGRKIKPPSELPDWQYRIQWCRRQSAHSLPWQPKSLATSSKWWQKLINRLFWLWRNRWLQEGSEVVGRNNLSLVRFDWFHRKTVIQETYWHSPWNKFGTVKSTYQASLEREPMPPIKPGK